jgi:hypothetical protein
LNKVLPMDKDRVSKGRLARACDSTSARDGLRRGSKPKGEET